MVSGLSLGPELHMILTGGMCGSWVAVRCSQSISQSRISTLTGAAAAVGGFFAFPVGGALFVMELGHRIETV
jgi:H+/Cl- antiporter ClcA